MRVWRTDGKSSDGQFIQNMNNKTVQERLRTEPKADPQEAFRFPVAIEEGFFQHKTYQGRHADKEIKQIRAHDMVWKSGIVIQQNTM